MPHLILHGEPRCEELVGRIRPEVSRWRRAVLKTEGGWLRQDGLALLVEGVVVEFSRPLHPVAVVAPHHGNTVVRLWARAPVERTDAVQRWLALLAAKLQAWGAGPLRTTNIPEALWSDLGLDV